MVGLRVSTRVNGQRVDVFVEGEIDLDSARRLENALTEAQRDASLVVVDLVGCDFMDSSGLRALLRFRRETDSNCDFKLGPTSDAVRRLLAVTGVTDLFDAIPTTTCGRCGVAMAIGLTECPRCDPPAQPEA